MLGKIAVGSTQGSETNWGGGWGQEEDRTDQELREVGHTGPRPEEDIQREKSVMIWG